MILFKAIEAIRNGLEVYFFTKSTSNNRLVKTSKEFDYIQHKSKIFHIFRKWKQGVLSGYFHSRNVITHEIIKKYYL